MANAVAGGDFCDESWARSWQAMVLLPALQSTCCRRFRMALVLLQQPAIPLPGCARFPAAVPVQMIAVRRAFGHQARDDAINAKGKGSS